ncbi:MAG: glycosyltransferase family 39 protein [Stenomitos frigidus ULC029]
MFFLLPIIAFVFFFLVFSTSRKREWRSSLLLSALIWALFLAAVTEFLSLFKLFSFGWLLGSWIVICGGLGLIYYRLLKKKYLGVPRKPFNELSRFTNQDFLLSKIQVRVWVAGIFSIILIVGMIALIAPPNTNDSMGYHMPRVMHWIQNHSVAHFPTNYTAQLFLSPWSAFAISHFQILSGSDRYANLIQWFAMIGSIIGVSLIAKQLGANLYGQAFAAVFCATIPMGILQGSSTQNDYVVAFWLVCLVYYILLSLQNQEKKGYYWQIGLSLGLATFSKPTAYLYAFPFLLWFFVEKVRLLRWQMLKPIYQIGILAILINSFHWGRNLELFHHPLGKSPDYIVYTNRAFSIPLFLSNIIKNISLHLSTPSPSINRILINFLSFIHEILGVDISDPRTSSSAFQLNSLINQEDLAANTIHLFLISIAIICLGAN